VGDCKLNIKGFCTGMDLKLVQLKSAINKFEGPIKLACKGCRQVENGQYKYVR